MLAGRISTFLCASLAFVATASAEEDTAPIVVQLRLPARDTAVDVFAWRTARGVEVDASALYGLGIAVPSGGEPVALSSVPGLSFEERAHEGVIVITCTTLCYTRQQLDLGAGGETQNTIDAAASGGYLNYETDLQWIEDDGASVSGIAQGVLFGPWGLIETSWLGQTEDDAGVTRLETSWTIDRPRAGVRARLGDSVHLGANGAPVRFGGLQIGRYFGLTPSLITYPTPAIVGDAESASTIELYVDGVLRAQSRVEAGPFVVDQPPVISGAGEAQLVVTDILGRQQIISRPFFVSTQLLRPGLSDWSVALGAERRAFGLEDARYGDTFAAARYRRGITDGLTLEGAIEATDESAIAQAALTISAVRLGQAYISRAESEAGGFTTASWYYDGRAFSLGAQLEQRDGAFESLGGESTTFRQGVSANAGLDMGSYGAVSFTAAQIEFDDEPSARTLALAYTPDYLDGAISFRLAHFERDESEFSAGISVSFSLAGDVSTHLSAEGGDRGATYRASAQRAVEAGRLGWRARASTGVTERAEIATMVRGPLGDTQAELGHANHRAGARVRHAGSAGWIENLPFAGRRIEGAFAIVDAGAANVSVARNQLNVGETGRNGRRLITNLRAYNRNVVSIRPDDLPIDRAPASPDRFVTPADGAGVIVRFSDARERVAETRVAYADGAVPLRGAILVRTRDGERFPIGTGGRVVLQGARAGDIVQLNNTSCSAAADENAVDAGLTLRCAVLS